ncbi:hypothetical protein HHL16_04120 [Pseudoflavitalea sp. G-6-1-2]|uniref:hypothetical protein n=1 Tax=Pseudoflavitalea sp. G-6-1-2 TaxID=2728841 RepID=UPI00146A91C2|nr:hypothetical protein [Pseudoflavitalea sp. G-6-1-2]NML20044.1 hypothetical protein [Pseudoflavitalea sp. G-6-1-2]
MKYTIYTGLLALLFAACNNSSDKKAEDNDTDTDSIVVVGPDTTLTSETIQKFHTAGFTDYVKTRIPSFDWSKFKYKSSYEEDSTLTSEFSPPKSYYANYGSFLKYSPDSTRFIDLDSYNIDIVKDGRGRFIGTAGGPDTEVSLINPKTGKKERLLFMGPGGTVEDAFWLSNNELAIVGTQENEEDAGKKVTVWKINLTDKMYDLYELDDLDAAQKLAGTWRKERLKGVTLK